MRRRLKKFFAVIAAISETLFRALDMSNCLSDQAHVNHTWGAGAFPGDDAPTLQFFLSRLYASGTCPHRQFGDTKKCGFDFTSGGFDSQLRSPPACLHGLG